MALSDSNKRKEFARSIAVVQKSVSDLGKYLQTSIPFMAEVVANGENTGAAYAKVWTDFLEEIETVQNAVKAQKKEDARVDIEAGKYAVYNDYTVTSNFNTINDYVAERFIANIEGIATRADSRLAGSESARNKQMAGATLNNETRKALLAKDGGMFNAIIWYVEGIGYGAFADGAAFAAPFTALVTAIDTFLADWSEDFKIKVSDKNIETITPYTLKVLEQYIPTLEAKVDRALTFAPTPTTTTKYDFDTTGCTCGVVEGGTYDSLVACNLALAADATCNPVTPTYHKITCTGAGTGTCDVDTTGGTDFADDPTCGGTDFATCTALAPTPNKKAEREAELQAEIERVKLEEEAKKEAEAKALAEAQKVEKPTTFGLN